jgi:hypothetical protein
MQSYEIEYRIRDKDGETTRQVNIRLDHQTRADVQADLDHLLWNRSRGNVQTVESDS